VEWVFERVDDSRYTSIFKLTLVNGEKTVRELLLISVNGIFELRDVIGYTGKTAVLSGKGWSSNQTELNCSETILKMIEQQGYPELAESVLGLIKIEFDH